MLKWLNKSSWFFGTWAILDQGYIVLKGLGPHNQGCFAPITFPQTVDFAIFSLSVLPQATNFIYSTWASFQISRICYGTSPPELSDANIKHSLKVIKRKMNTWTGCVNYVGCCYWEGGKELVKRWTSGVPIREVFYLLLLRPSLYVKASDSEVKGP